MAPTSTAMELKVLISILQSGQGLQSLLTQVNQVSAALTKLQSQSNVGGGLLGGSGSGGGVTGAANAAMALARSANAASQGIAGIGKNSTQAISGLQALENAVNGVARGFVFLTRGFLAYQGVQFVKSLADQAARAEVLNTVLHIVANNAGYTEAAIEEVSKSVQRLGITAQSANQSLTQFLQAGLDIKNAAPLARAAQDLAVLSGMDSSQTFQRLIVNIQQLDALGLRWMGLVVDRAAAEQKFAQSVGKTADALSQQQKQEALLQAVLEKSKTLSGAYVAAMGDVGKQLTSLARLTTNLATAYGNQLLPAYSALVREYALFLDKSQDIASSMDTEKSLAQTLGDVVGFLARQFFNLLTLVQQFYAYFRNLINITVGGVLAWKALGFVWAAVAWIIRTMVWPMMISLGISIIKVTAALWNMAAAIAGVFTVSTLGTWAVFAALIAGIGAALYWMSGGFDEAAVSANKLIQFDRQLADARNALADAQRNYLKARDEGTAEEEVAAEAELEAAKKAVTRLEEAKDKYIAEAKVTDEDKLAADQAEADLNTNLKKFRDIKKEAETAAAGLGTAVSGIKVLPKDFAQDIAQLRTLGNYYEELTEKLEKWNGKLRDQEGINNRARSTALVQTIEKLKESVKGINSQEALQEWLTEQGRARTFLLDMQAEQQRNGPNLDRFDFAERGPQINTEKKLEEVRLAGLDAAIGAEQSLTVFRTRIDARTTAFFDDYEDRLSNSLDHQLQMLKTSNERIADENQQAYDRGERSLEDYFGRRAAILNSESAKELAIAVNNAAAARRRLSIDVVRTPEETARLRTDLVAAEAKVAETQARNAQRATALDLDKSDAKRSIQREILTLQLKNAAAVGGETEALAVLNEQYRQQLETLRRVEGAAEAIATANALAAREEHIRAQERLLKLSQDTVKAKQQELDLDAALVDIAIRRAEADRSVGLITSEQLKQIKNEQVLRQLEIDRDRLAQKQAERAIIQGQLDEQVAKNAERERSGLPPLKEEIDRVVQLQSEFISLTGEVVALDDAVASSTYKLITYGEELRRVFETELGNMLTNLVTDYQNAMDHIKSLSKSLETFIVRSFMTNVAEKITQTLSKTGVFSTVMKLVGLGPKELSEADRALIDMAERSKQSGQAMIDMEERASGSQPFHVVVDDKAAEGAITGSLPDGLFGSKSRGLESLFGSNAFGPEVSSKVAPIMGFLKDMKLFFAGGGRVSGPGTGTSDSIPAMLSAGEHVMPADKAAEWMPLLEGIRTGKILPFAKGGSVQSIALGSMIPRRYAGGGVVTDGGASTVAPGGGGNGNMVVSLHPDALNMTMRQWLEQEVVRQQGRR